MKRLHVVRQEPESSAAVMHIATTNLATEGFCGEVLQDDMHILATFMKFDAYLRHWFDRQRFEPPFFCRVCLRRANAAATPLTRA